MPDKVHSQQVMSKLATLTELLEQDDDDESLGDVRDEDYEPETSEENEEHVFDEVEKIKKEVVGVKKERTKTSKKRNNGKDKMLEMIDRVMLEKQSSSTHTNKPLTRAEHLLEMQYKIIDEQIQRMCDRASEIRKERMIKSKATAKVMRESEEQVSEQTKIKKHKEMDMLISDEMLSQKDCIDVMADNSILNKKQSEMLQTKLKRELIHKHDNSSMSMPTSISTMTHKTSNTQGTKTIGEKRKHVWAVNSYQKVCKRARLTNTNQMSNDSLVGGLNDDLMNQDQLMPAAIENRRHDEAIPNIKGNKDDDPNLFDVQISDDESNRESCHIYVGGLHPDITEDDLRKFFAHCGTLKSVRIDWRRKGYGFITFGNHSDARNAIIDMNARILRGQPIK
ncbi:hypothetical protein RFI_40070, partial [Reticulomyxa filosa]